MLLDAVDDPSKCLCDTSSISVEVLYAKDGIMRDRVRKEEITAADTMSALLQHCSETAALAAILEIFCRFSPWKPGWRED